MAASRPEVRPATIGDLSLVVELRLALLREHPTHPIYGGLRKDAPARARELFAAQIKAEHEVIFLAFVEESVAGILRCMESVGSLLLEPAHYAYVSSVYVKPEHRRRGVLRALVRSAEQWATKRGLDQMRLHNVVGSEEAEAAWSALGFDVVEQVRLRRLTTSRA